MRDNNNYNNKTCSKCLTEKSVSDFSFRRKAIKTENCLYHSWCKECVKAYDKNNYKYNDDRRKATTERSIRYRDRNRQYVFDLLVKSKCKDCGAVNPVVLQFDHVRGEKAYDVSTLCRSSLSLDKLKEEISKCEIRCANCHLLKTAKQFKWWVAEQYEIYLRGFVPAA
jgi:hypothetical protein